MGWPPQRKGGCDMVQNDLPATTSTEPNRPDPRRTILHALKSTRRHSFRTGVILGSIVTVAVVLLIIQNGESAQLDWIAFHFRTPLWIMLFLTAAAGAVTWELIKAAGRRARRQRGERRDALLAAQNAATGQDGDPL